MNRSRTSILPGFGLSMGITIACLGIVVLLPLAAVFIKAGAGGWPAFWQAATSPRVLAAYRLSFGLSIAAALINGFFGLIVAWVLARHDFPGRKLVDALVDLPFALPTAVAGIALTAVYSPGGWLGAPLQRLGIQVAFAPLGILVALVFIGLPFVVRTLQPVIEDLDPEIEEAAASLGANRGQTLLRVILPSLLPALLAGTAMAFARGLGEYGSVVFIAGNLPMKTEIAPLLIMSKLEQFDYTGAAAIATVMLVISFALLLGLNALQAWRSRR